MEYCPQCKNVGKDQEIKRLISLGGKGVVELTGQDLVNKLKSDVKALKSDVSKSEKLYANMLGDDKYQSLQVRLDKQKRDKLR